LNRTSLQAVQIFQNSAGVRVKLALAAGAVALTTLFAQSPAHAIGDTTFVFRRLPYEKCIFHKDTTTADPTLRVLKFCKDGEQMVRTCKDAGGLLVMHGGDPRCRLPREGLGQYDRAIGSLGPKHPGGSPGPYAPSHPSAALTKPPIAGGCVLRPGDPMDCSKSK